MANGHSNVLNHSSLNAIIGDLSTWRVDSFIRELEKHKRKGRVLPFVRGLRLSALLIYEIRKILSTSNFTADWGHILDKNGNLVSNEADIIVHTGGYHSQWNGNVQPVMDFKFINHSNAKLVISCKSYIKKAEIDKNYCDDMKDYIKKIWLFAECCGPRSAKSIEKEAKNYGYKRFFYLYTWAPQSSIINNSNGWQNFIDELKKIK